MLISLLCKSAEGVTLVSMRQQAQERVHKEDLKVKKEQARIAQAERKRIRRQYQENAMKKRREDQLKKRMEQEEKLREQQKVIAELFF